MYSPITSAIYPDSYNGRLPRQVYSIDKSGIRSTLLSLCSPSLNIDLIRNKLITVSGNAKTAISIDYNWSGTDADNFIDIGATGGFGTLVDLSKPWSFATRINSNLLPTSSLARLFAGDHSSSGGGSGLQIGLIWNPTTSSPSFFVESTSGPTAIQTVISPALNTWYDVLVTSTGGSNPTFRIYINGVLQPLQNGGTSYTCATAQVSGIGFRLMNPGLLNQTVTSQAFSGYMLYAAIWQQSMDAFSFSLAANPFQLFEPGLQLI